MTRAMRTIIAFNYTFIALFGSIALFTLIFPKETHASCNGTVTCGRQVAKVCQDAGGATCSEGELGCTCVDDCRLAESGSCSPAAVAQCDAASVCSIYVAVCHISGSCSWSSPPPPPPSTCGNGIVEPGETCSNCPADAGVCPPGPPPPVPGWQPCGSCSCASIGIGTDPQCQINDVGVCVWNPASCGSGGGHPKVACEITPAWIWPSGPNIYPNSLAYGCAQVQDLYDGAGLITRIIAYSDNPSVLPYNASVVQPDPVTYLNTGTSYCMQPSGGIAVSGGTANIIFQAYTKACPACGEVMRCATSRPVTVAATNPFISVVNTPNPFDINWGGSKSFNTAVSKIDPTINISNVILWRINTRVGIPTPTSATADGVNYTNTLWGAAVGPTGLNAAVYAFSPVTLPAGGVFIYPVPGAVVANQGPTVTINNPTTGSNVILGSTVTITASAVDPEGDAVTQVEFQVDGAAFPPSSTDIAGPPWSADWTPSTTGAHTIRCRATDSNGNVGAWTSVNVNTIDPNPWFQVAGGNIVSRATISSPVPLTLGQPFIIDDIISGAPGVAIFRGSLNINSATLSSTNWKTDTNTLANIYNYAYFANLAEGKTFKELPANTTLSTNDFASAALDGGYAWIRVNGDASLGGVGGPDFFNVNKRAIVFVNGDLTINDKANLNAGVGNNFLMLIVRDDIIVNPDLSSTDATDPALHGVFFAGGSFNSGTNGTDDERLVVRGTVAATNINLERDLNVENIITPAEMFIFSPELVVNYPPALSVKHLNWREVAP